MPSPFRRGVRWVYRSLLWDPPERAEGAGRLLWGTRKLVAGLLLTVFLTWREWVEHHPPEIALIAVMHFAVVMIALAMLISAVRWFRGGRKKSPTV